MQSRQWRLADRPRGRPIVASDFQLVTTDIPEPSAGQMLLRTRWLGFAPAQKGWMENVADYAAPMAIGDVMRGSAVSEVVGSHDGRFLVGTMVEGSTGWTEYHVADGKGLTLAEPGLPPSVMLSVLGTSGLAAWCGLFKIGKPLPGDTVLVSGAAGAVGSLVSQLAKIAGCKVVGIAGGEEKCAWLRDEVGLDGAVDYKAGSLRQQLKAAAPAGADIAFDNVGGSILNDMLGRIATGARVVISGGISRYEADTVPPGPANYFNIVFRRASMAGFIVLDWEQEFPAIRQRLAALVRDGRLAYREDIQHGFENAPATLNRLFSGANRGKQLLQLD